MKILVHLHLFYQDMLTEMLELLRNLDGYDYDLFATVCKASHEELDRIGDLVRRAGIEVSVSY